MKLFRGITTINKSNDIRYRGPLSYRHIRIIGWIGMAMSQAAMVILFAIKTQLKWGTPVNETAMTLASDILANIGSISIPLFLVANFALILNSKEDIVKIIRNNAILAGVFYVLFCLLYYRYALGSFEHLFGVIGKDVAYDIAEIFFSRYLTFNFYIDLLMCALLYFFLIYRPKKLFQGNKIYWFRALAILPVAYEIAGNILKGLALGQGLFTLPLWVLPLLTSKPIPTFVSFFVIICFLKGRELWYVKKEGGTIEGYKAFLDTNTNSFQFSAYIAITFVIAGLLDLGITAIIMSGYLQDVIIPESEFWFTKAYEYANTWGFGKSISLIIGAPIILLFSYTRTYDPKTKAQDFIIPITGFIVCVLVWFEGIYDTLLTLHIHQQNSSSVSSTVEAAMIQIRCLGYHIKSLR